MSEMTTTGPAAPDEIVVPGPWPDRATVVTKKSAEGVWIRRRVDGTLGRDRIWLANPQARAVGRALLELAGPDPDALPPLLPELTAVQQLYVRAWALPRDRWWMADPKYGGVEIIRWARTRWGQPLECVLAVIGDSVLRLREARS